MSTTQTKRPLAQARADAEAFRDLFKDCYLKWEIAGSVRRKVAEVGDIEHVVIPKFADVVGAGLFAEPANLLWHKLEAYVQLGTIHRHMYSNGFRWGEKYRGTEFRGFTHEIFTAFPESWGAQLAIRTGPWEFSKRLVTDIQKYGYRNDGGCVLDQAGNTIPVETEQEYLKLCGFKWIEPEARR